MTEYRFLGISNAGAGYSKSTLAPEMRISVGKSTKAATITLTERDLLDIIEQSARTLRLLAQRRD